MKGKQYTHIPRSIFSHIFMQFVPIVPIQCFGCYGVLSYSYIGKYSIVVLITHQAYRFFIRNILYQMEIPQDSNFLNLFVFIILMLIELPTIKYGIKYLPVCFAQKDLWK